ncbi:MULTISPECIES: DNA polymerase I [Micromonospora]|uniref:DNA polymerase I n=1 Tax=Micromonospora zamorensis TaxID=709883 RepID=A0ABZ1PGV0_9ACTN|nr:MULTISPECIES: DNA polymerase I [Micromonospora]MBQ0981351.1 DNA polymerase I [Micromonospora sp. M61]MBQ1038972.1 DNA polymerase I [Micromonospora sp. C81]WSK50146.1 DNA polymerase I [Micromonospora zamorensis]WTE87303.1 DNA polymerase I [Micromonospora zamorensis]WTI22065.1 DNA polymerase I [Micromonospora zamorensis]
MTATTPRLLLVDGHSMAYRAFFALPVENFSTTTGQPTNAVYGFTSMLINVLRDEQPTHIVVAFDVSRHSFRTDKYAEYKAGRSETPTDFKGQVSLVKEVLAALQIPVVEKEGFEADDVIATLACQARDQGMTVLISSGDRDAFQLVDDQITVLYPRKGVSDLARMDPAAIEAKYGVPPQQYRDLAALVGETSDNLPGIPGVGPKTAAKWIITYGGVEGVIARADEIKGKAGDSLRERLADVIRNYEINCLVSDLELPLRPEDARWTGWDREAVHQVFDTLEFRILRDRLYQYLEAVEPEAESGFDLTGEVLTEPGTLAGWLTTHAPTGTPVGLAVKLDTGPNRRHTASITGLALATAGGAAAWVDPATLDPTDEGALASWLADEQRPKVLHDSKPAVLACAAHGWQLAGIVRDTQIAAYLARPDQRSYDLTDLALRYLHRELRVDVPESGQLTLDGLGDEGVVEQNLMLQARATLDLADAIDAELSRDGEQSARLMAGVELPLMRVLAGMESTGIAADTHYLSELEAHFAAEVKAAAQGAYEAVGREFNLGSPKQLQEILFTELGLPKTKKIKTGYTTDADALQWLYAQQPHPVLAHLLRHRDVAKLKSTVDGLLKSVSDDGRIHTTFNQTVAATGRLSSTEPNLQNIPIRTEEGRRIRRAFVVGEGYECLLTADYSQIEMRIMAHLSSDDALIDAFNSGADFHAATASSVFGVPLDQVTPDQRRKIKAMNYGLAYGLSAFGLSQQLGINTEEARGLMENYFAGFGGVRDYLHQVVARARQDGYTSTILGRRRYLPDLVSDNRQRRDIAERMALNAPIQGSAADIIKVAMLHVDTALREAGLRSRMLLQVHDELVFEVAPGEREALEALVRHEMGGAYPLSVPLEVSVGEGRDWNSADH